jgi:hypothetical protein
MVNWKECGRKQWYALMVFFQNLPDENNKTYLYRIVCGNRFKSEACEHQAGVVIT